MQSSTHQESVSSAAFALGGLAGVNLHSAGFLRAALEKERRPSMLSCTSGTIASAAAYLKVFKDTTKTKEDKKKFIDEYAVRLIAETHPLPASLNAFSGTYMSIAGIPGIYAPAIAEYWSRWMQAPPNSLEQLLERALPARLYNPTRSARWFEDTARVLQDAAIPVFTNSFEPGVLGKGTECVYLNRAAQAFMDQAISGFTSVAMNTTNAFQKCDVKKKNLVPTQPSQTHSEPLVRYASIDADAVKAALWLFDYGFEDNAMIGGSFHVDGAYHRQMIINEFTMALHADKRPDAIFALCPQRLQWSDRPRQALEQAVFRTEMFMNASYAGEVALIEYINNHLGNNTDHKRIDVIRIDNKIPVSFLDYFVEREDIYKASYEQGLRYLNRLDVRSREAAAAPEPPSIKDKIRK